MDDLFEVSMLLDFYGQLITKRQYEILDLHYNSDYSLGEIAEYLNISRQGVFDNIKRAKAALNNYEEKLKLVGRFSEQKHKAKEILELLGSIDSSNMKVQDDQKLKAAEQGIQDIINSF
jgi:uncharacterized protein